MIAEPMRPRPDVKVVAWLDRQAPESLFTTAITLSELLLGVELLPAGKRKVQLKKELARTLSMSFADRILPFDERAARWYAEAIAWARLGGRAIAVADGQIAGIAISHGFSVATRDGSPFVAASVPVIDPWTA